MYEEMREKIAEKLYQQRWYGGQPTWEKSLLKELFRNYADQLLNLKTDTCHLGIMKNKPELPENPYEPPLDET